MELAKATRSARSVSVRGSDATFVVSSSRRVLARSEASASCSGLNRGALVGVSRDTATSEARVVAWTRSESRSTFSSGVR